MKRKLILIGIIAAAAVLLAGTAGTNAFACGTRKYKDEIADLHDQLAEADAQANEFRLQAATLVDANDDLKDQLSTQKAANDDLQQKLAAAKKEENMKLNTAQMQISQLEDQTAQLNKQIAALTSTKTDLENQLTAAKQQQEQSSTADEKQISQLEDQRAQLNKQIGALTSTKNTLESRISSLKEEEKQRIAQEEAEKARIKQTYESLVANLHKEIQQDMMEIKNYKDALTITIAEELFFPSGSADIKQTGKTSLTKIGEQLKNVPDKMIKIVGNTDNVPIGPPLKDEYPNNWMLGAARSTTVAEFLRTEVGIDPERIIVESRGQYDPVAPNTSAEDRAKNRRIVMVIENRSLFQLEDQVSSIAMQ
jgi:chemotaxis protein MotB